MSFFARSDRSSLVKNRGALSVSYQSSGYRVVVPPDLCSRDSARIQTEPKGDIGQDQHQRRDGNDQVLVVRQTIERGHIDENGEAAVPIGFRQWYDIKLTHTGVPRPCVLKGRVKRIWKWQGRVDLH